MSLFDCGSFGGYDVLALAGQSNCGSGASVDLAVDIGGPRSFQYMQSAQVAPANEPLDNSGNMIAHCIGFMSAFVRTYYVPKYLGPGRAVMIVPCGFGSTGFNDGNWRVGDPLYEATVARCNSAIALYPGNTFKGLFWMQGENDASESVTQVAYKNYFVALAADFRSRVTGATNCPIVVGGMVPGWVGSNATFQPVQNALIDMPNRVTKCAYADPASPSVLGSTAIHYTAADQRLFAGRFDTAYQTVK